MGYDTKGMRVELFDFIKNHAPVWKTVENSYRRLEYFQHAGAFNYHRAQDLLSYRVNFAATMYAAEYSPESKGHELFSVNVRKMVAQDLVDYFLNERALGNYWSDDGRLYDEEKAEHGTAS